MYSEFSQALSRYTHNLLARNTLSETLQNTLLHHLGVSPWSTENASPSSWPLQVYPRTLSVLAQVDRIKRIKYVFLLAHTTFLLFFKCYILDTTFKTAIRERSRLY